MNAYELSDALKDDWADKFRFDAANMLRQQADRIADLEKLLKHSVGSDCREMRYIQEIENKDARIAEFEKKLQESAMNYISICSQADEHYARVQELEKDLEGCEYFLNKTKPLSDKEIEQIAKQHLAAYAQFIGAGEVCYEGEIEFARAIEERHGIK